MDMQKLVERIDLRLGALGMTASEASERATGSKDTIRNWKRAAKTGSKTGATVRALEPVARVLETSVSWLVEENDEGGPHLSGAVPIVPSPPLSYAGIVQAGDFRPVDEHFDQDDGDHMVPPGVLRHPKYPHLRQAAWQVRGNSMDEAGIRDGMWVVGAVYMDYVDKIGELYNGQFVVVERTRHGGSERELTVKEVQFARGGMRLVPRSSDTAFRELFVKMDESADSDIETIGVIAVVLSAVHDFSGGPR